MTYLPHDLTNFVTPSSLLFAKIWVHWANRVGQHMTLSMWMLLMKLTEADIFLFWGWKFLYRQFCTTQKVLQGLIKKQPQDFFHKPELKCSRADIAMLLTLWCVVMGDHVNILYFLIAVLDPQRGNCVLWGSGGADDHVTRPSEQIHSFRRHLAKHSQNDLCRWNHLDCLCC